MNILNGVKNFLIYDSTVEFLEDSISNKEGCLGINGQLWVPTGEFTGRAADDKYLVSDGLTDVTFGPAGKKFKIEQMTLLSLTVQSYLQGKDVYAVYFRAGGKNCFLVTEKAWHCVFVRNMFVQIEKPDHIDLTIIDVPGCLAEPNIHGTSSQTFIACDFKLGLVLIGGTHYAGEIKKSVFSYISYHAPETNVLPMHSSVTTEHEGWNPTVFFGLSGTGKTTLSAFKGGKLLGDDEHLWSVDGITNIEAGCYAKAINLSNEKEPLIWNASHKFMTVLENVSISEDRKFNFSDKSITENTRSAYPLSYVEGSHPPETTVGHPKNIIMLTCDAYGVLPGVSKLDAYSAAYHFISGYTSKVAGTEKGFTEPSAVFSPCFGGPFMAKNVNVYANLLFEKIEDHQPDVWLVNTGWIGGGPGVGKRMDIDETRKIISMIVSGKLKNRNCKLNTQFNLQVPENTYNSDPKSAWTNAEEYDKSAENLVKKFIENNKRFIDVDNGDISIYILRGGVYSPSSR